MVGFFSAGSPVSPESNISIAPAFREALSFPGVGFAGEGGVRERRGEGRGGGDRGVRGEGGEREEWWLRKQKECSGGGRKGQ